MSGPAVVDASALAAVLFGEPRAEEIAARLGDRELLAPTLLPHEIASVALAKLASYPGQREPILAALALYGRLEVSEVEVPPVPVVELAEAEALSVYDAAYLWLHRELGCELVTLDRRLAAAARPERPPEAGPDR